MFEVITIGAATRDVFLQSGNFRFIKSQEFAGGTGECLALGSKNEVQDIFFSTGGGATNAAVTFARLGLRTAVLARVGRDASGEEIVETMKKEGVSAKLIQSDIKEPTAYSTLLMYGPGERTVLVYRGPSTKIDVSKKNISGLKAKWIYVTSLGGRLDIIRAVWAHAKRNKIKICWNPGGEELKLGFAALKPLIKQCEVFNLNRDEAARLTGCERNNDICLMDNLCGLPKAAIITDGGKGAYACAGGERYFVASLGTKPRNTTGAGDAFGSGFAAGMIKTNDVKFSLELGTLNADSVIRMMGAKTGILKRMPGEKELKKVKINIF